MPSPAFTAAARRASHRAISTRSAPQKRSVSLALSRRCGGLDARQGSFALAGISARAITVRIVGAELGEQAAASGIKAARIAIRKGCIGGLQLFQGFGEGGS